VAVGGDNGNVYFFDWEGVLKRKVAVHDAAVTAIVSTEVGAAQYVTGGFDGQVKLWSSKFEGVDEVSLCTNETVLAGAVMGQDMKGVRGCVKALDCVDGRLAVGT
jgi:WD40 repeat protein